MEVLVNGQREPVKRTVSGNRTRFQALDKVVTITVHDGQMANVNPDTIDRLGLEDLAEALNAPHPTNPRSLSWSR